MRRADTVTAPPDIYPSGHEGQSLWILEKRHCRSSGSYNERAKGTVMIDYDPLEGYHDAQGYDLEEEGYDEDCPLTEQWARSLGGPLLDLACGTGTMAIRMAAQGYQVTGVDIIPEMIEWASQKAASQAVSIEWVVADARTFHLQKQFPFIYIHTGKCLSALSNARRPGSAVGSCPGTFAPGGMFSLLHTQSLSQKSL